MWGRIGNRGHKLVSSLFSVVYPSVCPVCKSLSDALPYAPICMNCWGTIKRYDGPSCRICAAPLVSEHSNLCGECLREAPPFSLVLNYGIYSDTLSEAIHLLKFSGLKRVARPLGKLLLDLPIPLMDGIIPVPMTGKTLRERGFNQTLLLSRTLSKHLGIPVRMDMLYKKRETSPQLGLRAKERAANLKNAFAVRGRGDNLRLILLDDVMTTGATVRECSKALLKAGAKEVVVVTLARSALT
ncbi:MAG TPA: ComF family protein [Thermodesulfovibrionales bacterium]|nr:ComF family protein [Thermodesulfovibrionales bacterium]